MGEIKAFCVASIQQWWLHDHDDPNSMPIRLAGLLWQRLIPEHRMKLSLLHSRNYQENVNIFNLWILFLSEDSPHWCPYWIGAIYSNTTAGNTKSPHHHIIYHLCLQDKHTASISAVPHVTICKYNFHSYALPILLQATIALDLNTHRWVFWGLCNVHLH